MDPDDQVKQTEEKRPGLGQAEMAVLRVLAAAGGYLAVNDVRTRTREEREASRELIRRALSFLYDAGYLARRDKRVDNRNTSFYAIAPKGRMTLGESV